MGLGAVFISFVLYYRVPIFVTKERLRIEARCGVSEGD
jgi:hypothetical protein